jgi:hypothetical protein
MNWMLASTVGVPALAGLYVAWRGAVTWRRAHGKRIVSCPETHAPEAVDIDKKHAFMTGLVGRPELSLAACSRWPERAGCGQECLSEIETSADACLVLNRLSQWYSDKVCVLCQKPIGPLTWHDHRPGFLTPDRRVLLWPQVDVKQLEEVLRTHEPLCWDCGVIEGFIQKHPDQVVLRPEHR